MATWHDKARKLANELICSGELWTPAWKDALCEVPRHELVPYYYHQNEDGSWRKVDSTTNGPDIFLDTLYSDTTLITRLADYPPEWGSGRIAVSSSTMPSLMISMLEALNVHDGDRVLEIGTGTGYNAALLSHRLGGDHVFSVDVDTELVEMARKRLNTTGYAPTVVARDGDQGLAEHAPYDRIIATCAVPAIPRPWIKQTKHGGLLLVDFKPSGDAGNLVLLRRQDDIVTGRFLPTWAGFMNMRHPSEMTTKPRQPRRDHAGARERHASAPTEPWMHPVPWFLAQFGMRENLIYGQSINETGQPTHTFLSATDGSWCEVSTDGDNDSHRVIEHGPVSLWYLFERAYDQWRSLGEPTWERFGMTVTPDAHTVWLDYPDGPHRWTL